MINIPDPCKEDFSKMTPTERGAFCGKCQTDTFDFRHLSSQQINQILIDHKGEHVCGRFTKGQLDDLNAGYLAWKNQTSRTFQSKFLLACVIVFGLTLFSCETEEEAVIEQVNQIEMTKNVDPKENFINKEFDAQQVDLLDYVVEAIEPIVCDVREEIAGDIAYDPEYLEYDNRNVHLAGMIAYDPQYIEYIEPLPVDTVEETTLPDPIEFEPYVFEAIAYPNPTQENSTVMIEVEEEGQFDIMLYNMNGQLIQTIHSGILTEGRQQFEIEMYDFNSGTYLVNILSQGQNETLKIQKVN